MILCAPLAVGGRPGHDGPALGAEAATGPLCRALYERSDGLPLVVEEDVRAMDKRLSPTGDLGGELDRI